MAAAMKYFKLIYNSFLWSITIAALCFKSEWLQMRVNTGHIFWGLFILLSIVTGLYLRKRKEPFNWIFTTGNLIICFLTGIICYGFDRLKVVPAALIREGIHQTRIPFATINLILLLITAAGLLIIIISDKFKKWEKRI